MARWFGHGGGEKVLFVHSQANCDTRTHLIGGDGDLVWQTGSFNSPLERDPETWFIRGGSAGAMLHEFLQPGVCACVNHNLIEAGNLGATAQVPVGGEWNNDLIEQVAAPVEYDAAHEGRTALPSGPRTLQNRRGRFAAALFILNGNPVMGLATYLANSALAVFAAPPANLGFGPVRAAVHRSLL